MVDHDAWLAQQRELIAEAAANPTSTPMYRATVEPLGRFWWSVVLVEQPPQQPDGASWIALETGRWHVLGRRRARAKACRVVRRAYRRDAWMYSHGERGR